MENGYLGVDHIGIAVHDFDKALETYRDILGFIEIGIETLEDRGLRVGMLDTGNSRLEILAPENENSEITRFLTNRGEGIHHICIRVKDIEHAINTMRHHGATIVGDGIQRGASNSRVAFIHPKSTHGVLLELVETQTPEINP